MLGSTNHQINEDPLAGHSLLDPLKFVNAVVKNKEFAI